MITTRHERYLQPTTQADVCTVCLHIDGLYQLNSLARIAAHWDDPNQTLEQPQEHPNIRALYPHQFDTDADYEVPKQKTGCIKNCANVVSLFGWYVIQRFHFTSD